MRKWGIWLICASLILMLVGCQSTEEEPAEDTGAPTLIGLVYNDVISTPEYANQYTIQVSEQFNDNVAAGVIFDQDPRPGQAMRSNVIRVVVSKGSAAGTSTTATPVYSKKVPDVNEEFLEKAVDAINKAGFTVDLDTVEYVNHPVFNRGVVIEQLPLANTYALTGTPIQLTVASGFTDATVSIPFPSDNRTIDLEIYIDGKKQSESDVNIPLSNILVADCPSLSFKTTLQKDTYKVEVCVANSGTKEFRIYATYTVNGNTGGVERTALYDLPQLTNNTTR